MSRMNADQRHLPRQPWRLAEPRGSGRQEAPSASRSRREEQFLALCAILDIPGAAEDERFARARDRKRHRSELTAIIEEALAKDSAANWARALNAAGVPAGCVLDLADAIRQPQVLHRQLVSTLAMGDDEELISLMRAGFQVGGEAASISAPPPTLGEHTDEVLRSLGYDSGTIDELRAAGVV